MTKQEWIDESLQKYLEKVGGMVTPKQLNDMREATNIYADVAIKDCHITTEAMSNILYNLYIRGFGKQEI